MQDSNLRPPACKAGALPAELTALGRKDHTNVARVSAERCGPAGREAGGCDHSVRHVKEGVRGGHGSPHGKMPPAGFEPALRP